MCHAGFSLRLNRLVNSHTSQAEPHTILYHSHKQDIELLATFSKFWLLASARTEWKQVAPPFNPKVT
jgi:hypothetical protein